MGAYYPYRDHSIRIVKHVVGQMTYSYESTMNYSYSRILLAIMNAPTFRDSCVVFRSSNTIDHVNENGQGIYYSPIPTYTSLGRIYDERQFGNNYYKFIVPKHMHFVAKIGYCKILQPFVGKIIGTENFDNGREVRVVQIVLIDITKFRIFLDEDDKHVHMTHTYV